MRSAPELELAQPRGGSGLDSDPRGEGLITANTGYLKILAWLSNHAISPSEQHRLHMAAQPQKVHQKEEKGSAAEAAACK